MAFTVEGLHHVGVTVRDMKRSFEWYTTMFGFEPGTVNHGSGAEVSRGVQVEAASFDFSMVQVGAVRIEFLEYKEPQGDDFALRNCDVGATHICLQVDNLDAAYETLLERGANFNAPPATIDEGELAGSRWAYLRDPDGIQIEMWQWPSAT